MKVLSILKDLIMSSNFLLGLTTVDPKGGHQVRAGSHEEEEEEEGEGGGKFNTLLWESVVK